jgi:hypothetical protein
MEATTVLIGSAFPTRLTIPDETSGIKIVTRSVAIVEQSSNGRKRGLDLPSSVVDGRE